MAGRRHGDASGAASHRHSPDFAVDLDLHRHRKDAAVGERPVQRQNSATLLDVEPGERCLIKIGVEEPAIIPARHIIDDGDEVRAGSEHRFEIARARIGTAVDQDANRGEKILVADQLAQAVQNPRALQINVVGGSRCGIIDRSRGAGRSGYQRKSVANPSTIFEHHCRISGLAFAPSPIERLHIGVEALVQPEIVPIRRRQLVGEPFVAEFVVEKLVEALGRPGMMRAIGGDGLMLHAAKRGLHHRHFLVPEGIGADYPLVKIERRREFVEQLPGAARIPRQEPVEHRDLVPEPAAIDA